MIRRIALYNFMSHSDTVIEPAAVTSPLQLLTDSPTELKSGGGLTVLIGENNSGKSAIVTALQVISQNASGDFMVRHGETECEIRVETLERQLDPAEEPVSHVIQWRRQKGKVSYVLDGREIDRLKGGTPDDLHEKLRLSLVQTSRDEFDVHIGEQKRPIFLLGDKSSDRAAFFASSSDTCKLIEMQELHRSKIKLAKSNRKQKLETQVILDRRLEILEPLGSLSDQIENAEAQRKQIESRLADAENLRKLTQSLDAANRQKQRCELRNDTLKSIRPLPTMHPAQSLSRAMMDLIATREALTNYKNQLAILSKRKAPPTFADTAEQDRTIQRLMTLRREIHSWSERKSILEKTAAPPALPGADQKTALRRLLQEVDRQQKMADKLRQQIDTTGKELEELNRQICKHFDSMDQCPTCGQKVDVEIAVRKSGASTQPAPFNARFNARFRTRSQPSRLTTLAEQNREEPAIASSAETTEIISANDKSTNNNTENDADNQVGNQVDGRTGKSRRDSGHLKTKKSSSQKSSRTTRDSRQKLLPIDLNLDAETEPNTISGNRPEPGQEADHD